MKLRFQTAVLGLGVLALVSSTGCATIMQGSKQQVSVTSTPSGASVTVDGVENGTTPVVLSLKRKDNHVVRIAAPGYQPYEVALSRSVSGWVAGNIVFGGIIGLVVDASTGGMYKLSPEQIEANLGGGASASAETRGDALYVAVVLQADPSWERIGTLARN